MKSSRLGKRYSEWRLKLRTQIGTEAQVRLVSIIDRWKRRSVKRVTMLYVVVRERERERAIIFKNRNTMVQMVILGR